MIVCGKKVKISGKFIKIARLEEEWYEDLNDSELFINCLKNEKVKADILTFWQRLPDIEPTYNYYMEYDSIAALPITTFDGWWKKQINAKTRNVARKAEKKGVQIKLTVFDDNFVKGLMAIFNETPIRQNKPFWHYGKDFEKVKKEFSKNIHREDIVGAYLNDELIGFIMLAYADRYAMTTQILSKIGHNDKSPTNALLAKAVEICEKKKIPYLNLCKVDKWVFRRF